MLHKRGWGRAKYIDYRAVTQPSYGQGIDWATRTFYSAFEQAGYDIRHYSRAIIRATFRSHAFKCMASASYQVIPNLAAMGLHVSTLSLHGRWLVE